MLKSGNLGGKCADLNALYVGLARAAGLPSRDIYGVRVAPSKFGYKSLGAGSEIITTAQHCRSEVLLAGFGWVPVDPADVRKVVLEEPPTHLAMNAPAVVAARKALFGAWEGNWLAYNFGHDIALPGSSGPKLGFLMYPQVETAGARLDCLESRQLQIYDKREGSYRCVTPVRRHERTDYPARLVSPTAAAAGASSHPRCCSSCLRISL